jgi:transcriptional antiterminator NusG
MDGTTLPEMTIADLDPDDRMPSCQWPRTEMPRSQLRGLRWHVVHIANPSDDDVTQALKNAGYENYYPKTIEMRALARRHMSAAQRKSTVKVMKRVEMPLFKAYRFVRYDVMDGRWHDLFELVGIRGVLCIEGTARPQPAPVMDEAIAALRATEINGLIPGKVTVRELAYRIGEEVRINNGPFIYFNGVVQDVPAKPLDELDGSERLKLLVSLFGTVVPVELEIGDIEKLPPPRSQPR